jgi:hypothetical protein
MTGRRADRLAVERAVEAWRKRRDEPPRPEPLSDEEVAALARIDVATLEELAQRFQVWPSFACGWSVDDVVRLTIAADLSGLGVPPLVLGCVVAALFPDKGGEQWVRDLADDPSSEVACPITNSLGETWVTESGLVYRPLWTADDLARLNEDDEDDEDLGIDDAASDADARASIARGEAVAYREGAAALRVLRAVGERKDHGGLPWAGAT